MKALYKLLIFLLISASSYSQYYTPVKTPLRWDKGGFDSLFLPTHDTTYKPSDKTKHWIVLNPNDAILYGWFETGWTPLVGHTGLVITSQDTARWNQKSRSDTTFMWFDGYSFAGSTTEEDPLMINEENYYDRPQVDSAIDANKQDAMTTAYRRVDSVFGVIGGEEIFLFIDSVGVGGGGGGTTSYQTQTASGSTTFTFTSVPASVDDYIIFVNGAAIRPTTDFTTSGNTITIPTIVTGDVVRFQRIK